MGPNEITLIAFAAFASLTLAAGLVARDLVFQSRTETASTGSRLRRRRNVFDATPATTFWGRLDQGFDRLVIESGSSLSSFQVLLFMVAALLLLGGGVWLYTDEPLTGVAAALGGLLIPLCWMAMQRSRRMRAVRDQLPHMVDLLARATRAGRSIEQALSLIASDAGGVLGKEFQNCEQQLQIGRSFDKALMSLAQRIPLMEMQILATTLIVQRRSGGHLSETLDRMVVVIRDRLTAQRQVRASTAAGRMSTIIVASIAPLALVFLFGFQRDHLQSLFEDALGRSMLLTAMVLEVIGLVWVGLLLRADD